MLESKRIVDLLQEWDEDRSGTVDKNEFRRAIKKLDIVPDVPATKGAVEALFNSFLIDGQAAIYLASMKQKLLVHLPKAKQELLHGDTAQLMLEQLERHLAKERVIDLFHVWDADRNGRIDRAEFSRALELIGIDVSLKKTRKDVEEVFRVFDTTGSGDIDYQARPTSSAVV